ncbi:MAG TPA: DUF4886 domain-containing protein [Candidatus Acidoferrales bacterium]|nr:DUF4886 domain-containing protein [Candidatus Acidoferrales bacterium]
MIARGSAFDLRRRTQAIAAALLFAVGAQTAFARTILFVGNSFTFGDRSPVKRFHPERVTDLNKDGFGGVPALFKTFTTEAGLDYDVSLETSPGKSLTWHYTNEQAQLKGKWDVVTLQGYSTLDQQHPGDPADQIKGAHDLAKMMVAENPDTKVYLVSTWSRADQTYKSTGHWYGKPIYQMAEDVAAANAEAAKGFPELAGVIPVGTAWNRAMQEGVADPNPFDGVDFGKVDLWTWDQYHASAEGYYLEALVIFGKVTGVDPVSLGAKETAANDLGMSPAFAVALQKIAREELAAEGDQLR